MLVLSDMLRSRLTRADRLRSGHLLPTAGDTPARWLDIRPSLAVVDPRRYEVVAGFGGNL